MLLSDKVTEIKGVGREREVKLNKLGIFLVKDLLEYFPRTYQDRSIITEIDDLEPDQTATIRAKISERPQLIPLKTKTAVRVSVRDKSGKCDIIWYNMPYIKNSLILNQEYIFTGKISERNGKLEMTAPDFDAVKDGKVILSNGRIVPVYSSTQNFSQKILRNIIYTTIEQAADLIGEFLPESVIKKYELCSREFAVKNIHFPESDEAFFTARRRLVFEELFMLRVRLKMLKVNIEESITKYVFENTDTSPIEKILPFEFTNAQKNVLEEIKKDLKTGHPMNRLVQGDVGSGKTAVAASAMFIAVNNGKQAALMAPTDVLARQHYISFLPLFEKLGKKCVYLASAVKGKEKKNIIAMIESGEADIVIGTHAIIQEKIKFKDLAFAVTDEQHRFGVKQRCRIEEKGDSPHILVMTATPIPRTLGLILYGDLNISTINELPPGRQKIDTFAVDSSYYGRLYKFIEKNAEDGGQTYIICPSVEGGTKNELKAVTSYTEKLQKEIFPNLKSEYVHGKMDPTEKQLVMEKFAKGETNILVATTVIEVGINVPNATIMLVENADRFGLSQLHQLRGRVGRGSKKSYCILVSDSKSKVAKKRLKIMTSSNDGFEISMQDLDLRGPGDFFGTRQHGIPEFKIANLYKDIEILKEAQKAAEELLKNDERLENAENTAFKKRLYDFYTDLDEKISL